MPCFYYNNNVPLQDLDQVRIEHLLARTAWTIFPHLGHFMSARRPIKVPRRQEHGTRVTEELDGEQSLEMYGQAQAKSSSISPRKRPTGQMRGEESELEDVYSDEPGKILTSLAARCAESTNAMLLFGKISRYVDPN